MTRYVLGGLRAVSAAERLDLLAPPVAAALAALRLLDPVGVVEIDPDLSDTVATELAYRLPPQALVNCVLVGGRRDGEPRVAACLVPSTKRVDVNGFVRRRLDVRKASFLPQEAAVEGSGMAHGGITVFGLPASWSVLVDPDAVTEPLVVMGSGVRRSKLVLPGTLLARLPGAEVDARLARPAGAAPDGQQIPRQQGT